MKTQPTQYRLKFDTQKQPFFVNMENGQSWHLKQRVMTNGISTPLYIDSFYLEGHYTKHPVKQDENKCFTNPQALLVDINGQKMGYAIFNNLKPLDSPNYSYHTDLSKNTLNPPNYLYLLLKTT